jgi:hypothetical protein
MTDIASAGVHTTHAGAQSARAGARALARPVRLALPPTCGAILHTRRRHVGADTGDPASPVVRLAGSTGSKTRQPRTRQQTPSCTCGGCRACMPAPACIAAVHTLPRPTLHTLPRPPRMMCRKAWKEAKWQRCGNTRGGSCDTACRCVCGCGQPRVDTCDGWKHGGLVRAQERYARPQPRA